MANLLSESVLKAVSGAISRKHPAERGGKGVRVVAPSGPVRVR